MEEQPSTHSHSYNISLEAEAALRIRECTQIVLPQSCEPEAGEADRP